MPPPAFDYAGTRYNPGARHGHVESYFIKANSPDQSSALWLKATIYAPDHDPSRAVAEAWAIAFDRNAGHVAVKSWVPYEAATFARGDFNVSVDGCTFSRDRTRGRVVTADRSIEWDLGLRPSGSLVHLPARWMYEGRLPSTKLVTLLADTRASGHINVLGKEWRVDGWPAMLGHNWGRDHAPRYAWGHCNLWEGAGEGELVFEGVSAQVPVGPVLSPVTTLVLVRHLGARHDMNGALSLVRSHGEITFRRWKLRARSHRLVLEAELWGKTDDFVGLFYPNPSGPMTYCLNTKLAHAEVLLRPRGGRETIYRSRAAALEIGTRDPKHGVRMYV
jgi:hypothetical protein